MKSLFPYLKDYKKECILGPVFKLLEASFELLVPLVVAAIIDIGIRKADKNYIIYRCLILAALGFVGLLCSVTAQFFAAKAAVGFAAKLRQALFSHVQGLSFTEMDQVGTATLITRMSVDVNQVQSGVNMVLRLFLRSPFIVFGAMIMAFRVDSKSAFIFVILIPALLVIVFSIILTSIPLFGKIQAALDKVLGITRENLTGVRVIRAFREEAKEAEKFKDSSDVLFGIQMFTGRITGLMNPLTYVVVNACIIILLHTGAVRVEAGLITQGAVVALVNYMSQILVELIKLANLIITITKAAASADRIEDILKMSSSPPQDTEMPQDAEIDSSRKEHFIEFRQVSLRYRDAGEEALADLDFYVDKGETIGIIGGTGSGKSSLVHLLPRFYDIEKGSITIDGINIREYETDTLRRMIGIVMQKAVLFRGTIRDNLLWGKEDAAEEEMWEALRIAQAAEFVKSREEGLDSPVEQEGRNLSGGQRQRLTIARALVRSPQILILDDSASALDYLTESRLREALRETRQDTTVFIVSQRASSILHADKILVLDDGRIVGKGTHRELLHTCHVYQEIFESQFGNGETGAGRI